MDHLIADQIAEIVKRVLKLPSDTFINSDINLFTKGLDSLKMIEMIVDLEAAFKIEFNDDDLQGKNFSSIDAITQMMQAVYKV